MSGVERGDRLIVLVVLALALTQSLCCRYSVTGTDSDVIGLAVIEFNAPLGTTTMESFRPRRREYIDWLDQSGLASLFQIDSFVMTTDSIALKLRLQRSGLRSNELSKTLDSEKFQHIEWNLLFRLATVFDVPVSEIQKEVQLDELHSKTVVASVRMPAGKSLSMLMDQHYALLGLPVVRIADVRPNTELVHQYFRKRCHIEGLYFYLTHIDEDYVQFVIDALRGRIIQGKNYWEKIEGVALVVYDGGGARVLCLLDGYYAAGFIPPDPDDYIRMPGSYLPRLREYGNELLFGFRDYLQSQDRPTH